MNKKIIIIISAVILLLLILLMFIPRTNPESAAREFARYASIISRFEIESSDLILIKSEDVETKFFAQRIITEHKNILRELEYALEEAKLPLSIITKVLDKKHQKTLYKLHDVSFKLDKKYLDTQVKEHKRAIKIFKEYMEEGGVAPLKEFAGKVLPTLEEHIMQARQLEYEID